MANKTKKIFIFGSLLAAMFMSVTACDISRFINPDNSTNQGSNDSNSIKIPDGAVLNSILVINNKSGYERGEELDLTVTANYSGDFSIEVTDYQVEGFNNNQTGNQTITIKYEDKSFSLDVFVREPVLTKITVINNKQSYEYGEELDINVYANYSDGSSIQVENYQVSGYNAQNPGEQDILVSYEGLNHSLKVKVNDPILVNLSLEGNKQSYEYGEELDIVVTASYSDGSTSAITNYEVEGFNNKEPGNQSVVIKYNGKSISFNTTINNPVLTGITATSNKNMYEYGEELDIVVTASYSDNSTTNVTNYKVEGFDSKKPGQQTVTITYENKTYTLKVTVNNPVLTGITAVSNKETYEYGDDLDVIVEASYSDGSKVAITNYKVEGFDSKVAGEQTITISFEGKTCTLKVSVNNKSNRFPASAFTSFLNMQGIKPDVPTPIGYFAWSDKVDMEQDGTNYFSTTTKDEGKVGVDSLADQYAVLLNNNGWTVNNKNGEFTAYKEEGGALLTFSSKQSIFSLRAEMYSEFPTKKCVSSLVKTRSSISDGDKVVLASISEEFIVTGYENGLFKTSDCPCSENGPDEIARNAWRFTVKKVGNNFTLTDIYGRRLGATGLGQLAWNQGTTEWSILITTNSALIINTNTNYGRLCFNKYDDKVTTYAKTTADTHLVYPQLFKVTETDIVYPTSFSLNGKSEINIGKQAQLNVAYYPENTNVTAPITWSSSNEEVATVDNGIVKGISLGTATITASFKSKNTTLQSTFKVTVNENAKAAWTVMMYVCGSDLESDYGAATSDISEILRVSNQPDDVNVIIETGGTTKWKKYNISANVLSRYHVENKQLVLDETLVKANMGKRSTFESFLSWGLEEYPADKVGVILWNHGGALSGVCFDDSIGSDSLTNSETKQAFANVFPNYGIDKLEFIGYDACLMQVQDIAEFNSHYFNYMVTSQEAEVGTGWVYNQWIDDLYAGKDTKTILKANVDSFVNTNGSDQTLSYLDLSKMNDYYTKFEAMAVAIKSTAKSNYTAFKSLIKSVKYFTSLSSYGTIDGMDFLNKLGDNSTYSAYKSQINEVKTAFNQLVAYSRCGSQAGNSNGLSIIGAISCSYSSSETSFTNWRSIFK